MNIVTLENEMLIHIEQIPDYHYRQDVISMFAMVIVIQGHEKQYRTNH